MANNETNENVKEKELSLYEKIKLEIENIEKDDEGNILNNPVITVGEETFELEMEKTEENTYKINILGVHVLTLDENNEFSFSTNWEENLKEQLEKNKETVNGEDLVESLKEMELELEKEKEKKEEKEITNGIKKQEEQENEEKPEEQGEQEKENSDENETKSKNKARRLVYLNSKVFKELMPYAKKYGAIAIDKDTNEIVGKNHDTKEFEPIDKLVDIGRSRSDMKLCGVEKGEHKEEQAISMYQVEGQDVGFAIFRDGSEQGNFDIKYMIRPRDSKDEKDFSYIDLPMLSSNGDAIGAEQLKERTGVRQGREQGNNLSDSIREIHELDEEELLPDDLNEMVEDEMQPCPTTVEELKDRLVKILIEEKKMREVTAREVVNKMVDENKPFAQAEEEAMNEGGRSHMREEGRGRPW